jgi:hypothetical protein
MVNAATRGVARLFRDVRLYEVNIGVNAHLAQILAQKRMRNVRFEVQTVDDIPVSSRTRKFQLIVDARPGSSG